MIHVDVVQNEWLAGRQEVVARVSVVDGQLKVDAVSPEWEEIVRRPIGDLRPEGDPQAFLERLHEAMHGSYLFATAPHDESDCEHPSTSTPLRATGSPAPA